MGSWIGFQILKEITNDENLMEGLVLPGAITTKLSMYCASIKLLDSRNREYEVEIDEVGDGHFYKLESGQWPLFYKRAIRIDPQINMLRFRLVGPDLFRVMCFRSDGMEVGFDNNKLLLDPSMAKRCLIKASGSTYDREILPETFLRFLQKPNVNAHLFGSNQNATVDVLYNPRVGNQKAKATGFHGSQWNLFCSENNIDEECSMLFTRFIWNKYSVDVFNSEGVGFGVTVDPGNEEQLNNEMGQGIAIGNQGDVLDDDSEDDVVFNNSNHRCRINFHEHTDELPNFVIKFQSHSLTSNTLTFPKAFVREHQLHKYKAAHLNFGELHFKASLASKKYKRDEADLSHLVCGYDWVAFLEETGTWLVNFLGLKWSGKKKVVKMFVSIFVEHDSVNYLY